MHSSKEEVPTLTKEQAIIITGYTNILCCPFAEFQEAVENRLGRPVYTHEFASKELQSKIKEVFRADFIKMIPHNNHEQSTI
jgi:hypothetical protein